MATEATKTKTKTYILPFLEGAGQEMIIHDKSEIGGPIDQYSTIGYKFMHGGAILHQERILRVESNSSFSKDDVAN